MAELNEAQVTHYSPQAELDAQTARAARYRNRALALVRQVQRVRRRVNLAWVAGNGAGRALADIDAVGGMEKLAQMIDEALTNEQLELQESLVATAARADRLAAENAALTAALEAIRAEPFGCPFCDSGKLRNPAKRHTEDCGFLKLEAALAAGPRDGRVSAGGVSEKGN